MEYYPQFTFLRLSNDKFLCKATFIVYPYKCIVNLYFEKNIGSENSVLFINWLENMGKP